MAYYIIIRGPLGVGKSTIAQALTKRLRASYISVDDVLAENGLDVRGNRPCIPAENFIKADHIVLAAAKAALKNGKIVIFDGCFYHKEQIDDLERNLSGKHFVLTLKAPLELCVKRDSKREKPCGEAAAKAVHALVSRFDYGIIMDTKGKTAGQCVEEMLSHLRD
jgi:tRNA uridine 5-carbamoylmethylation protein Kti12